MKTLTIQQPFASLVCCGIKDVENRSWQTKTPPAHKTKASLPVLNDTKLTVHVCDKDWEKLKENPTEYTIDVNNRVIADIICKKNSTNPKPVTEIVFVHNKQRKTFEVKQVKRTKEYSRIGRNLQYKNLYYVTYNLGTSSQKAEKTYMQVAVRCIYYMAVTPSCDVINMNEETWHRFRLADTHERKQIVLELLGKEDMSHKIKEIAWIPLDGQNMLKIAPNYNSTKKRSKRN